MPAYDIVWSVAAVLLLSLTITALVSVCRRSRRMPLTRSLMWFFVIVLLPVLGALVWFVVESPRTDAKEAAES